MTRPTVLFRAMALFAAMGPAAQGQDHPLMKPYPGSQLIKRSVADFDEQELPLAPISSRGYKSQRAQGRVTRIEYANPNGRSTLEIISNYEQALKTAGFQTVYSCRESECGSQLQIKGFGYFPNTASRFLVARLSRKAGDVHVGLHVRDITTYLSVVESRPMETGLVKVTAARLGEDLARDGHVALDGIYFDFGKDELKPESNPSLEQAAELLKTNPSLRLHVVGHTDSAGDLTQNMDLSRRRAAAVVSALVTRYGVARERLRPDGIGPLSPVATNVTEQGRAKNRRVELVQQ